MYEEVLRHAVRTVTARRSTAMCLVLTMAAGLTATVLIFSLADGMFLRPLPYPFPERVVRFSAQRTARSVTTESIPFALFEMLCERRDVFQSLGAAEMGPAWVYSDGAGRTEVVPTARVSSGFLDALGARLEVGRGFGVEEFRRSDVVVLTHDAWVKFCGADRNAAGRRIAFVGASAEVIGVLRSDFLWPSTSAPPLVLTPLRLDGTSARSRVAPIGRLAPGVTVRSAASAVSALPNPAPAQKERIGVITLQDGLFGGRRTVVGLLFLTAVAVLLVATANASSVVSVWVLSRAEDISVRTALGASTAQIAGWASLVVLGLVVSAVLIALPCVAVTLQYLGGWTPFVTYRCALPQFDARLAGYVVALAAGVSVCVAIAPVRLAGRLARRGYTVAGVAARPAYMGIGGVVMVGGLVALNVVLLGASGSATAAVVRVLKTDIGYSPEGVSSVRVVLPKKYSSAASRRQLILSLCRRISDLPDVSAVAASDSLPIADSGARMAGVGSTLQEAGLRFSVTSGFWDALSVRLKEGAVFGAESVLAEDRQAVVSEAAAHRFFGTARAVGRVFTDDSGAPYIVTGIVADMRRSYLEPPLPLVYTPYDGSLASSVVTFVAKAKAASQDVGAIVAREIRAQDGEIATVVATLEERLRAPLAQSRVAMAVIDTYGVLVLVITCMGLYGAVAFLVASRIRETAIRMALGATRMSVLLSLSLRFVAPAAGGLVVGGAMTAAARTWMQELVPNLASVWNWGVSVACVVVAASTLAAICHPLRAALHLDPNRVLRCE